MDIKQQDFVDVPLFELTAFTIHELSNKGLQTYIIGETGVRYEDRYTISKMNYTDNSQDFIANMKSDNGIYKKNMVYLDGNVIYVREDGITFETQKATYNTETSVAKAKSDYIAHKGKSTMVGDIMNYNSLLKLLDSENVTVKYQLKEK